MSGQFQDRIQDTKERLQDWWADRSGGSSTGRLIVVLVVLYLLVALVVGYFWSTEPEQFSVTEVAEKRAEEMGVKVVTGFTTTSTLIKVTETLLHKPGGYLSNDVTPPGVWLDNVPNWEF